MRGLRAGKLREVVEIQTDAANDNDPEPSYSTTLMTGVPCSITTISGDESFRGRQLDPNVSHVVEMQRIDGVLPDMRINVTAGIHNGKLLHVQYVRDMTGDGTPLRMQLYCREIAAV